MIAARRGANEPMSRWTDEPISPRYNRPGESLGPPLGLHRRQRLRRLRRVHPCVGPTLLALRGSARGPASWRELGDWIYRSARNDGGNDSRKDLRVRAGTQAGRAQHLL